MHAVCDMRALHYVRGRSCAARPQAGRLRVCVSAYISKKTCMACIRYACANAHKYFFKCVFKENHVTRARKITLREVELASFLSPRHSLARSLCLSLSIQPSTYHRLSHYLSLHLSLPLYTHNTTNTHQHTQHNIHHLSASRYVFQMCKRQFRGLLTCFTSC